MKRRQDFERWLYENNIHRKGLDPDTYNMLLHEFKRETSLLFRIASKIPPSWIINLITLLPISFAVIGLFHLIF